MESAVGLRERRKERTRSEIISVATRMFADRGFEHVTVDEIAAAAEVSHRTFYRYFPAKEDLILGDMQQQLDALTAAFARRPTSEHVIESIRAVVLELAADYEHDLDTNHQLAALICSTPSLRQRRHERHATFEASLVPLIAARLAVKADDMRPAIIAACAVSAIRVATDYWIAHGADEPLLPIVQDALGLLTAGFEQSA